MTVRYGSDPVQPKFPTSGWFLPTSRSAQSSPEAGTSVPMTAELPNVTDEVFLTGALFSAGLPMSPGFLNPPRRFSVSLRLSY